MHTYWCILLSTVVVDSGRVAQRWILDYKNVWKLQDECLIMNKN